MKVFTELECRIMIYLSQVSNYEKRIKDIHRKLNCNYAYLCLTLRHLHEKRFLIRDSRKGRRNVIYDLSLLGKERLGEIKERYLEMNS